MKKFIPMCLPVLLLCFACKNASGVMPSDIVWGPENGGLRMNLHIENTDANQTDVYKVVVRLVNIGKTPVVLTAQWKEEEEKGDYREFLKKEVGFTSFPESPIDTAQTMERPKRKSPQPTLEIKPGNSAVFEWTTAPRHLKPKGYYNTSPIFPCDGLYSIRAKFLAATKQDTHIFLYSNDCQLTVGKSMAMPKFAIARIIQADAEKGTVLLDLGSDQKIEPGDRFESIGLQQLPWSILITEVNDTVSTGSFKTLLKEPLKDMPTCPAIGSVVTYKGHSN
jgi:hypothetical protein